MKDKKIVFTGVAGSGKTTMIDLFRNDGYKIVEEVARELIAYVNEFEPDKKPFVNRKAFQDLIEPRQISNYNDNSYGIFDRSLLDEAVYSRYFNLPISDRIMEAGKSCRFDKIFLFPPFESIYKTDGVRIETFEQAADMFETFVDIHKEFGYEPIIVPNVPIEERYLFIKNILNE